ncbi:filamentation protein [Phlyctema vagabunda]|uniref:Filamentation protein n=1 Tax=Phlyctema vagabunda TaxID=108571 RepID=A0ABR4P2K9_9HELO
MTHDPVKAARYIQLLDEARYDGDWDAVPELVRKVRKHAPGRTCLTLTAECEHAITTASKPRPSSPQLQKSQPSAVTTTAAKPADLATYVPLLAEAIEKERTYVEDDFQAQVCLAWLHWHLDEPALALARLPQNIEAEYAQLDGTNKESTKWTKVSAMKATYIKGSAQRTTGAVAEAIETFESSMPVLASVSTSASLGSEMRTWTELFLTAFCMTSSYAIKSKVSRSPEAGSLSAFRAWAKFWDNSNTVPTGGRASYSEVPRRSVWKEYYVALSDILYQGLTYPSTALTPAFENTSILNQQRAELKLVESRYEALLLAELHFPKAEEASEEVEIFVEFAMQNWRVLSSSGWEEQDLGEGGSEAFSRDVLAILYRAATMTFHSTAILRHLFTVHLAIAEFDLAFKAFDTYLEIAKKARARVEKSGEPEHGLDDDEIVVETVSTGIRALCTYGRIEEAEKAKDLSLWLEEWLEKHQPDQTSPSTAESPEGRQPQSMGTRFAPSSLAVAWRCVGIGHAQWARLTYDAASRADIQLQAIKCFRKALSHGRASSADIETSFALGVILAERREIGAAIDVVKAALLPPKSSVPGRASRSDSKQGPFDRERSLIPLWHLLALLLSARQEFATAARACEGAFEQFQDPKILFGDDGLGLRYQSEHLRESSTSQASGIVDEMSDHEKENVLEVKMTQLALIEVLEGPEVAVNASDELLSLYTRLFGDPQARASNKQEKTALVPPPQSSAGTIRSIKGSIFGRSAHRRSLRKAANASPTISEQPQMETQIRPQTTQTVASTMTTAPKIQVTNENGEHGSRRHLHGLLKDHPHHGKIEKRSASVSRQKNPSTTTPRSASTSKIRARSQGPSPTKVDGDTFFTPPSNTAHREKWLEADGQAGVVGLAVSSDGSDLSKTQSGSSRTLPPNSHNMAQTEKALLPGPTGSASTQDTHLPQVSRSSSRNPVTRFPRDQEARRRTSMLVRVWLLIASFYRRATMYEDAKGAIEEALKLVQSLESDVSQDTTGSISITNAGWGGGKSVSELLADVYSERGHLAVADASSYTALDYYESALTNFADHAAAIVGVSNILLDIYSEILQPGPAIPTLDLPLPLAQPTNITKTTFSSSSNTLNGDKSTISTPSSAIPLRPGPLGVASIKPENPIPISSLATPSSPETAQLDRLAARDRAYGLLSTLTKLGSGWNNSEAWFTLARAYEEGGQLDKARDVLWWCVELEEARAIRGWETFGAYVL